MKYFRDLKITTKILLSTLVPLVFVCFVLGGYLIDRVAKESTHLYDVKGETTTKLLAQISVFPLIAYDYWSLEEYVQNVVKDEDIIYASVLNDQKNSLTSSLAKPPEFTGPETKIYTREILHKGHHIGDVEIAISPKRLKEKLQRDRTFLLLVFLTMTAMVCVVSYLLFSATTKPLATMVAAMKKAETGDFEGKLDVKSNDEIGILSRVFNEMLEQLKERDKQLEQYQHGLEAKVTARTLELDRELKERKEAEKALRRSVTFSQTVLNSMPDAISIIDVKNFYIVDANRVFLEEYHLGKEEVRGKPCYTITHLETSPCRPPEHLCPMQETCKSGGFASAEHIHNINGKKRYIEVLTSPIKDENGETVQVVHVARDISARKQVEYELLTAKQEAEKANILKSQFLANMSHEIRTPMNAIIGLANLSLANELSDKQRDYINKILFSANSLLGIINDILDYSKIEAGKLCLEKIGFNLHDTLDNTVDMFISTVSEKGVELLISLENDVPSALIGDPLRLGQILINLTSNAIKFTESGEIIISVSTERIALPMVIIRFSVQDSGIGIPPDKIGKLFSSFTQVDGSTTRKHGGTGLGLTICKRLTEMMGGKIQVDSAPGKGSTFSFTAEFEVQEDHAIEHSEHTAALRGLRVLAVDDNDQARRIMEATLISFHFSVQSLSSGRDALKELQMASLAGEPYSLVLLDWKMPDFDGIETLRAIREQPDFVNLPVIMVTAFGKEDIQEEAKACGVHAIVTKPVKQSMLLDAIIETLGLESLKKQSVSTRQELTSGIGDMLRGTHVLLVEDNAINQQVATEILQCAGIKVEIASNGLEALARVGESVFDAVLMDVQMPEMDGYHATQAIRNNPRLQELPVIAMTANAIQGDREACLAAGMNDYVSKPIDTRQFFYTLSKWIKPRSDTQAVPAQTLVIQESPAEESMPDRIDGLDIKAGLQRLGGNWKLYTKLLREFIADFEINMTAINEALRKGEMQQARFLVHTVKGVAGNISALELHTTAQQLEKILKDSPTQPITSALDVFSGVYMQLVEAIRHHLPQEERFTAHTLDGDEAAKTSGSLSEEQASLLARLDALLQEGDLEAGDFLASIRDALSKNCESRKLDMLTAQIGKYDFEDARRTLAGLSSRSENSTCITLID